MVMIDDEVWSMVFCIYHTQRWFCSNIDKEMACRLSCSYSRCRISGAEYIFLSLSFSSRWIEWIG